MTHQTGGHVEARSAARACLLVGLLFTTPPAARGDAGIIPEYLRRSQHDLDQQLGPGEIADGWRKFLKLDVLRRQAAAEGPVDTAQVRTVRDRFAYDHEVLRRPAYAAIREALDAWLAERAAPSPPQLAELARRALSDGPATGHPASATAREDLRGTVEQLDLYLASLGANDAGWRRYLEWEALPTELTDGRQVRPDVLERVSRRLEAAAPLLSRRSGFRETALSLRRAAAAIRADATSPEELATRLDGLAQSLDYYARDPAPVDAERIAATLGWLQERGMQPQLVDAVRRQYCRPNLLIDASRKFAAAGVAQEVDATSPLRDWIRGTQYVGTAHTRGTLGLRLSPSYRHASVRVELAGRTTAQSTGSNGPLTVRSTSITDFTATIPLTVDGEGIQNESTQAAASSRSSILGIFWNRLLGRRSAVRSVYADQAATDRAVADRAEQAAQRQLDEQVRRQLAQLNDTYLREVYIPLTVRGNAPQEVRCRTTDQQLSVAVTVATAFQLASASDPPRLAEDHDLALRLHQSCVNNAGSSLLARRRVSEQQLADPWHRLFDTAPAALDSSSPDEPWTVTFADECPLTLAIGASLLTVELRANRFTVGDADLPGMSITAVYALSDERLALRQGSLQIVPLNHDPASGSPLGARQQVVRSMLRKRFERLLPERIELERLPLPAAWRGRGPLRIESVTADNGWLALACQLDAPEQPTGASASTSGPSAP